MSSTFDLSTIDGTNGVRIIGSAIDSGSGFSVSNAGDVNGDGFDDFIVGAYKVGGQAGASYVVFGKNTGFNPEITLANLNGSNGFRISGEGGGDRSGRSVSAAGDVNGDGRADLLIGAPFHDPASGANAGASYVVFGQSSFGSTLQLSSLNGANGFKVIGAGAADYSGWSVSSAGDINDDGIADFLIGAFRGGSGPAGGGSSATLTTPGAAYVVFGTSVVRTSPLNLDTLNGTNGFRILGAESSGSHGQSVSNAGDVNGDGIDDLIVGAPTLGNNNSAAYVVFGSTTQFGASLSVSELNGNNGFRLAGAGQDYATGFSVSSAGDVNGDGFDDVIVGAYRVRGAGYSRGASYVVFGKGTAFGNTVALGSLNGTDGFRIMGVANGDRSGKSVSSAGDVNGDGFDDLIIGADFGAAADQTGAPFTQRPGTAYIIYGKASGFGSNLNLSDLDGINGFLIEGLAHVDYVGRSVSSAGDVNGDGFDDVIIGADGADLGGNQSGGAYIIFGFATAVNGTSGADSLVGTAGGDTINGFDGNDAIFGGSGDDTVYGGAGDDSLDGGAGNDTLYGGAGNDVFVLSGVGDEIMDESGVDEVQAAGSLNLTSDIFDGIESAALLGTDDADLTGDDGANVLTGNAGRNAVAGGSGDDTVYGGAGDDTLDGGAGNDTLYGGAGNDVFVLDGAGDAVGDDSGIDEVRASFALDLSAAGFAGIEDAALLGAASVNLTGDEAANVLTGNGGRNVILGGAGNDRLLGEGGNDTLDGGTGNDLLYGGAGDDVFVLDGAGDRVFDTAGTDEVRAGFALNLASSAFAAIENAALLGSAGVNLTGDEAANTLTGNGGSNVILGGAGNDRLLGEGGDDTLDGGTGNDIMYGGAGDDVFVLDVAGDRVFDTSGTDEVRAGFALNLASSAFAGIEDAALLGAASVNLTGDEAANVLTGNGGRNLVVGGAGNDRLLGEGGNDTLDGGTGNDIMYGGAGDDVFVLDAAGDRVFDTSGTDEVRAGFALNLASSAFAGIEDAALLGAGHMSLTGDEAANTLTGNGGSNVILGGAGNDTLSGGAGNDTVAGGAGRDVMAGGLGNDVFEFALTADLTTSANSTDVVTDFRRGQDKIDLSDIDASTALAGNGAFVFAGTAAHGTAAGGEIYIRQFDAAGTANDHTLIYLDTDADTASEAVIRLTGLHGLTAGDFIL